MNSYLKHHVFGRWTKTANPLTRGAYHHLPLWYHDLHGTVAGYSGYGSSPGDSPSISLATLAERGLGHHNDEKNNGAAFGGAHRALPRPVVLLFSSL